MTKILKRVQQSHFQAMLDAKKKYEVRLADFDCKPGDTLILLEQKQGTKELTGRKLESEILFSVSTKEAAKYYSKEEIDKYGLVVLALK
jgi:hypothetical protein